MVFRFGLSVNDLSRFPISDSDLACRNLRGDQLQGDLVGIVEQNQGYAQTLILVNLMLVNLYSFLVIAFDRGGVTTCKFARIIFLFLPYLPIPTRTLNEGVKPQLFGPEVFKKRKT